MTANMMVFARTEHHLRSGSAQDAWTKLSRQGYKIAADDAKATKKGDEVAWYTSGGVVVAGANHLNAIVSTKGGKVEGTEENERRIAEVWAANQEGTRIISVCCLSRLRRLQVEFRRFARGVWEIKSTARFWTTSK